MCNYLTSTGQIQGSHITYQVSPNQSQYFLYNINLDTRQQHETWGTSGKEKKARNMAANKMQHALLIMAFNTYSILLN